MIECRDLFLPTMLSIMLMRKLVPYFVPSCGLITISQFFYKDCFKIFPIMLPLCSQLSEIYYAHNYADILSLGQPVENFEKLKIRPCDLPNTAAANTLALFSTCNLQIQLLLCVQIVVNKHLTISILKYLGFGQ